jgi:DNA-binding transcriptional MerR regulator
MPLPLPAKLYFRIGEVAGLVGVEPHVLRYWEREFRSIRPTKSAKGQRVYSRKDVEALLVVKDLLYAQGFTIAGAKKKLQRAPDGSVLSTASAAPAAQAELEVEDESHAQVAAEAEALLQHQNGKHGPNGAQRPASREKLLALRAEVEEFLRELGG